MWALLLGSVSQQALLGGSGGGTTSIKNISAAANFVAGWGLIKRNPDYTGPAMRVANVTNTDESDVNFDSNGLVTFDSANVYGSNTRVIRLYDQWGTEDFTCTKSNNIQVAFDYRLGCAYLFAPGGTGNFMQTPSTAGSFPAWRITEGIWLLTIRRIENSGLRPIWGADSTASFMAIGLWVEGADLHWRIDGGGAVDWTGTNWSTNADVVSDWVSLIGDMTQGDSRGYAYQNGISCGSLAYAGPTIDTYSNATLKLFNGPLSNPFRGHFIELHIASKASGSVSESEITEFTDALTNGRNLVFDYIQFQSSSTCVIVGYDNSKLNLYSSNTYVIIEE